MIFFEFFRFYGFFGFFRILSVFFKFYQIFRNFECIFLSVFGYFTANLDPVQPQPAGLVHAGRGRPGAQPDVNRKRVIYEKKFKKNKYKFICYLNLFSEKGSTSGSPRAPTPTS
jgi:hypothetical protein